MDYDDDRRGEPYFELNCSQCGCGWHAGDNDACPNCGASSYSFDASAAREYSAWADAQRDPYLR